jgi:uncharacterized protein
LYQQGKMSQLQPIEDLPPCLSSNKEGFLLKLYVQPGAGKTEVCGLKDVGDGELRLKVKVRERAQDGAANEAVIALIASTLGLPKSSISLTAGAAARLKTIQLPGNQGLVKRLLACC